MHSLALFMPATSMKFRIYVRQKLLSNLYYQRLLKYLRSNRNFGRVSVVPINLVTVTRQIIFSNNLRKGVNKPLPRLLVIYWKFLLSYLFVIVECCKRQQEFPHSFSRMALSSCGSYETKKRDSAFSLMKGNKILHWVEQKNNKTKSNQPNQENCKTKHAHKNPTDHTI